MTNMRHCASTLGFSQLKTPGGPGFTHPFWGSNRLAYVGEKILVVSSTAQRLHPFEGENISYDQARTGNRMIGGRNQGVGNFLQNFLSFVNS